MDQYKKHVKKLNEEMGSIDTRLGRLEGRIDEGFDDMKLNINAIFKKINKLPCTERAERITKVETKLKMIIKSRWIIFTAFMSSLMIYIVTRLTG
jgi:GTP-binding protein EngB required for normal cell division